MDLPSKEERIKLGNHGLFKGEQYKNLQDTIIFVESSEHQAQIIANVSGKDAFCVDNGKLYKPQIIKEIQEKKESKIRKILKKIGE